MNLLAGMVDETKDPNHPKVKAVADAVVNGWRAGEKTLIFCFRTHTARRLRDILNDRIDGDLKGRRQAVLGGGERSLENLRSRFTRREGDLVSLGLDRVLWSLRWAAWSDLMTLPELSAEHMELEDGEMHDLARLALRYGVDLTGDPVDRVFVHRATEHLVAKRLLARETYGGPFFKSVLRAIEDERWLQLPYGVDMRDGDGGEEGGELRGLHERGVHTTYTRAEAEASESAVQVLADDLRARRERARRRGLVSVFDTYAKGPSFWLGSSPETTINADVGEHGVRSLAALHEHLIALTRSGIELDWRQRLMVLQALRRALMRESVLLRILPDRDEKGDDGQGEMLVRHLHEPLAGQRESMADRLAVFAEDLRAAGGAVHAEGSPRHAMYEATRLRDTGFVVLVDGSTNPETRERVFAGFNGPLLPEVLVVTAVGQEGIDLHRHCRNVIHYDLAWNPAVLEQRTGRVDRLGSKTFRERAEADAQGSQAFLEVGVPFLAGTYDERMYEEIRVRAQTFEVLTGGDVATDNLEGRDDADGAEGKEEGLAFPVLPPQMVADLRVKLHVWPVGLRSGGVS
jgi:hypothetical protein